MAKKIDLTGRKVNKLTVIRCIGKSKHGGYTWLCRCDCGRLAEVESFNLTSGQRKSCGQCVQRAADIAGAVVGDYEAIERVASAAKPRGTCAMWRCVCRKCGHEKEQAAYDFRRGVSPICPVCSKGTPWKEINARRDKIRREQEAVIRAGWKAPPPAPTKPKAWPTMAEINAAAREKHMTYGQYMAEHEDYIKRHGELPQGGAENES